MAGYGQGQFMVAPPPASEINLTDLFQIVTPKAGDPNINSAIDATYPNTGILTYDGSNQLGGMWAKQRVNLTERFELEAYLYLGPAAGKPSGSAEGLTFTLHNDPDGLNALGGAGEGLGVYRGQKWSGSYYGGKPVMQEHGRSLQNAVVIEFDTAYNNGPFVYDPAGNTGHCALVTPNANVIEVADHRNRFFFSKTQPWSLLRVSWEPNDSGGGTLHYAFNGAARSYTIESIDAAFHSNTVYWGFTAASGQNHALQAFALTKLPEQGIKVELYVHGIALSPDETEGAEPFYDGDDFPSSRNNGYAVPLQGIFYQIIVTATTITEPVGPIIVTDTLPEYANYYGKDGVSINGTGFSEPQKVTPSISGQTITVNTGTMLNKPGDFINIQINALIDENAPAGTVLYNNAVVSSQNGIVAPQLTRTVNTTVITLDWTEKEVYRTSQAGVGGSAVEVGDIITYRIPYGNSDRSSTVPVSISDTLPLGLDFIAASNKGTYNAGTRTVSWNISTLLPMRVGWVTLDARVNSAAYQQIENAATIDYGFGPVASNVAVNPIAQAPPSKAVSAASPNGQDGSLLKHGDMVLYEIAYHNPGTIADDVMISDTLPLGISYVNASDGGQYNPATRTVTWLLEDVPAGESGTVLLTVYVNSMAAMQLTNYATVGTGGTDPVNTNVTANPIAGSRPCPNTCIRTKCRTTITGKLVWNDNMNLGNTRPPVVEIILLRDGEVYRTISVDTANDTDFTFYCVPLYKNSSQNYTYTVDEQPTPAGYEKTIDGNVIINTLM